MARRHAAQCQRADIRRHRELLKQQPEQRKERNAAAVAVAVAKRHRQMDSNGSVETGRVKRSLRFPSVRRARQAYGSFERIGEYHVDRYVLIRGSEAHAE